MGRLKYNINEWVFSGTKIFRRKSETEVDLKNAISLKSKVDKLDTDNLENVPNNLRNLKSKIDILDVDKLVPLFVDLVKLSDVAKIDVIKKDVYKRKIKRYWRQSTWYY